MSEARSVPTTTPQGDIALGQRFIEAVYTAFARSPQWQRGVFVLLYDEWGGFFDHVHPPVVPDALASSHDIDNFGQLGFRVPSLLASPYARRGYVDHNLYDHSSILRFLEWRFLGAPAQGPGNKSDRWFLTKRDRYANNYGASLRMGNPDPELEFPAPLPVAAVAGPCNEEERLEKIGPDNRRGNSFVPSDLLESVIREHYELPSFTPWLKYTNVRDVPVVPNDRPR